MKMEHATQTTTTSNNPEEKKNTKNTTATKTNDMKSDKEYKKNYKNLSKMLVLYNSIGKITKNGQYVMKVKTLFDYRLLTPS